MSKKLKFNNWFSLTPALSYNAIFYFINTVRNIGKTWGIEKSAWRRAYKHGKKAIYVRRFRKEASEAAASLYESQDVIKFCTGLIPYDKETGKGNFKKRGSRFYIKRNGRWDWFLKVIPISKFKDLRSADDVNCDRIYFDEYTTTPDKFKQYHGNEVDNFIDLCLTVCRQHEIKVIFCGNKESVFNPYFQYFDIKPLPSDFQGIKTYREGTILVQQYNLITYQESKFQKRLKALLKGTPYADFLYGGAYKDESPTHYAKPPNGASGYLQLKFKDINLNIKTHGNKFYISSKNDISTMVFTDKYYSDLTYQTLLNKKTDRNKFRAFQQAYLEHNIIYDSAIAEQGAKQFATWCGIVNQ